jgi:hypothetical protein
LAQGLDLEDALDELYDGELADFTARRDTLAKALRDEDRTEDAERVKQLRKPTVPVWIVNQLARRNRRDVDLLLDAGHRAREAQRGVLSGSARDELEQALQSERIALQRLTAAAHDLSDAPSASTIERVARTLRAAAVTDEGRELLARGRLTAELEPPGFETFGDVDLSKKGSRSKRERGRQTQNAAARRLLRSAEEREQRVRARLEAADSELARAKENVAALRAELKEAERAVADARKKVR